MKTVCAFLAAVAILAAQDSRLTDADVTDAIASAKQQRFQSLFVEARGRFMADFSVILQGPVGRTRDLAREAFESYKPLEASAVPDHVRAHEVTFAVIRRADARSAVTNVVIMPVGAASRDAAIQPLPPRRRSLTEEPWRDAIPRTWRPGFGAEPARFPRFYRFAQSALPPGDLQIIVATDTGEQRYTVSDKDRDRIR